MGQVYFYHVTQSPIIATLATLLEKSLQAGWRVAVRGVDAGSLAQIDDALWRNPRDGFLPHGLAGGPHDADQPVLLTTKSELPNGATCLISLEGATLSPEEISASERACVLFDGTDPESVDRARAQWKTLTSEGAKAIYWSEETGSWVKKAESS
ncbi:DNA polymerase III subunit chi [Falsihalocynthiibacter arcticus]|uniref:DNA polymerase III subunit chi n=1 Tax=Falsihalocynthiibacter arcticus TaxID=1579316 RepID=A0A126V5I0_9RHOB|nr:DNA polymerase III subunit chi [Falsihalocynthiibacter arcticus]AML53126.1 DNA polymerase III subunit chi [Falsihalocynthiibacter arcticus]